MGKIIGIDLGTTNSVAAVWDGREPRVLINRDGARLTPSVVAFGANGDVFVGQSARRQAIANADSTVASVKRFIGQRFRDVEVDAGMASYEVVAAETGEALIVAGGRTWSPAQISACILKELKDSAEAFLGEPVDGAVITVPAYFNDAQRAATKEAGRLAGLDVKRIINEPTAAALAYGLDSHRQELVAVYDFGGGTFDVSILQVGDELIEVVATHGDTHLGGDDIDVRIVSWLLEHFRNETGCDVSTDLTALQRLRESAEQAKIDLSVRTETEVSLPFLGVEGGEPRHLQAVLTREALEDIIADLVDRTLLSCAQALSDARKSTADIDEVVLVGGSSRIPLVQQKVAHFFSKDPRRTVNPDEVVALGAAVQAGVLSGEVKGLVLLDVTSLSLGVRTYDGATAVIIPRNTTIPVEATRTFSTAVDGQTTVEVHVLQGESPVARENDSLGRFDLEGIQPQPAGSAQIDVTFSIDLNGMVEVSARDRASGRSQRVTVAARMAVGGHTDPKTAELPEKVLRREAAASTGEAGDAPRPPMLFAVPGGQRPPASTPQPQAAKAAAAATHDGPVREAAPPTQAGAAGPQDPGAPNAGPEDSGARRAGPQDSGARRAGPQDSGARRAGPQEWNGAGTSPPASAPPPPAWGAAGAGAAGSGLQEWSAPTAVDPSRVAQGPAPITPRTVSKPMPSAAAVAIQDARKVLEKYGDNIPGSDVKRLESYIAVLEKLVGDSGGQREIDRALATLRETTAMVTQGVLLRRPGGGAKGEPFRPSSIRK